MHRHGLARWTVQSGRLLVEWRDKTIDKFPFAWLLDHQTANWHASTNQKIEPASKWRAEVVENYSLIDVGVDGNGHELVLRWNNEHVTSVKVADLRRRTTLHSKWGLPQRRAWKSLNGSLPQSSYSDKPEDSLKRALSDLAVHGVHMITNMPSTSAETEAFVRRTFGPPRETFYGGMWDTAPRKEQINDTAYTYDALDPHTDTCYLLDSPGLQIFNCVAQDAGMGGKTRLVDAEMVATILRADYPDTFGFFCETPLVFHHTEKGLFARVCSPVITLEVDETVKQFRYNEYDLARLDYLAPNQVDAFYEHNVVLAGVIKQCEHHVKLQVGEMLVLDNHRIMHGRTAFKGYRNLIGCYVGADDWIMRARSIFADRAASSAVEESPDPQSWKQF